MSRCAGGFPASGAVSTVKTSRPSGEERVAAVDRDPSVKRSTRKNRKQRNRFRFHNPQTSEFITSPILSISIHPLEQLGNTGRTRGPRSARQRGGDHQRFAVIFEPRKERSLLSSREALLTQPVVVSTHVGIDQ